MTDSAFTALMLGVAVSPVIAFILLAARKAAARVVSTVFGWFFVSHVVQGSGAASVQEYFRKRRRFFSANARSVWQLIYVFVRPEGARRHLFHRSTWQSNAIMFHGCWPILYAWVSEQGGMVGRHYYLRGTVNWLEVLRLVQADEHERTAGGAIRYRVSRFYGTAGSIQGWKEGGYPSASNAPSVQPAMPEHDAWAWRPLDFSPSDIGPPNPPDPFRHLALGPEAKRVVRDAKFWLDHAVWHQEREIPWRWGCLLKGGPGTGKTSLARSIAQSLDLPIVIADLASMSNRDLSEGLRDNISRNTPCMLVLEDIDTVFSGRENVAQSSLTFDALLNFLDGVEGLDGVMTFVTTNRPETLDPALTRPGRLDAHVELPGLDAEGRLRVARLILQDETEAVALAKESPEKESPAEFKERCCRRARELLWAQ